MVYGRFVYPIQRELSWLLLCLGESFNGQVMTARSMARRVLGTRTFALTQVSGAADEHLLTKVDGDLCALNGLPLVSSWCGAERGLGMLEGPSPPGDSSGRV